MKHSKRYLSALKLIEKNKAYSLLDAITLLKKMPKSKFVETIELTFNLNIDAKQADQQLRGVVNLPAGTGKTKRVLTITSTKQDEAREAGSDLVGFKEEIEKIARGEFNFDIIVATPEVMPELSKHGKILGPRGLMPNPKTGTMTTNVKKAIEEIKAGKVDYRNDKDGNLHIIAGNLSFSDEQIEGNIRAIYDEIMKRRPNTVKGNYVEAIYLSSTMSPSVFLGTEVK